MGIKYIAFKLNHDLPFKEPEVRIEKDPYRSFGRKAREMLSDE
jgi:tRNA (guanine-N7-)-methyltransferase